MAAQAAPAGTETEARKGKRARVLFKATIRARDGESEARIRDLSKLGALIEMDAPPALDSDVLFVRGRISAAARVAWMGGNRAGLQFESPINEKELLAQSHTGAKAQVGRLARCNADYRRPGVQQIQLSARERKLARVWAAQMGLSFDE